jgi:two-component system, NarL family, nitrate/nitrite sensor histidine kinase NarX
MKNFFTIKGQIILLLGSFFILVLVSVGVMFWSVRTQKSDAIIINLAGRQRMLSQKLTWLSLTDPEDPEFHVSIEIFEQTVQALRYGGTTVDSSGNPVILPPAPDLELQAQLDEVTQTWKEFQVHLQSSDASMLSTESARILSQLDAVVSAFESRAEAKHQRLELIQLSFLIAAILLLLWGFILTRHRIVTPMTVLGTVVQKMTEGDLNWAFPPMENDELGELAGAFETMRTELAASRGRLEAQVTQRTRELVSAFEFSQEIVAERERAELINSVVERARLLMGAQAAALCILSPDGNVLEMVGNNGDTSVSPGEKKDIGSELMFSVVGEGKTVSRESGCANCAFLDENPDRQCFITPLRAMDRTIGALCVVRSDDKLGEEILLDSDGQRALALLANSAAVAITNTRLAKLEHQKVEQEAALAEREQLAAHLHDDLAQTLSFTRLKLEQLEEVLAEAPIPEHRTNLNQITAAIDLAYQQVRSALTGLLRPVDDDFFRDLSASVADFNRDCICQAELKIIDPSALEFPSVIQLQILHVVREALSNIQQHAQASQAWVQAEMVNGIACYTVEDNGVGFDLQSPIGYNHFGLQIMQTRIERSGGSFSVVSVPKEGTKVSMTFPIEDNETKLGYSQ